MTFSNDFKPHHLIVNDLMFEHNVENDFVSHCGDDYPGVENRLLTTPRAASPRNQFLKNNNIAATTVTAMQATTPKIMEISMDEARNNVDN